MAKKITLITVKEATELTKYAAQTFYNMIYNGELKSYGKKGRGCKVLLDKDEVFSVLGIETSREIA